MQFGNLLPHFSNSNDKLLPYLTLELCNNYNVIMWKILANLKNFISAAISSNLNRFNRKFKIFSTMWIFLYNLNHKIFSFLQSKPLNIFYNVNLKKFSTINLKLLNIFYNINNKIFDIKEKRFIIFISKISHQANEWDNTQ